MANAHKNLGIYIHIPFCAKKCAYCDFYSVTNQNLQEEYVLALLDQIESKKIISKQYIVDTVYIGGGTPSILPEEQIGKILGTLRNTFKISDDAEITIEANPGTLDGSKLAAYRAYGINRLSIGLQSANNDELRMLSRIHSKEEFENTYMLSRMEGFDNINIDIMYALPNQKKETFQKTLDYVISLSPEHISMYGLKIEENTPFGRNPLIKKFLPDEDTQYEMYMDSCKKLDDNGYVQYEISNFSKKGLACKHNMKYWTCSDYIGFGPCAYSFADDVIYSYVNDIDRFISCVDDEKALLDSYEKLSLSQIATQYVMVGFRLRAGINTAEYARRFGESFEDKYSEKLEPFIEDKFVIKTSFGYRLSRRGMMISNYILSEILDFDENA